MPLQTVFMKKHPRLARKLKLLYNLKANPKINNNQHLANLLGVSRQSVSKWGTGSDSRSGDAIPDAHFFRIGQLFGIDSYLFTLEYQEFEREVRLILKHRNRRLMRYPRRVFHNKPPTPGKPLRGREAELLALNEAWGLEVANVVQVTGGGGAGKSALVNEWLMRMGAENYRGADTVFTWSFDSGCDAPAVNTTMEAFFDRAFSLFDDTGDENGDPETTIGRLIRLIRAGRALLVLDGVQTLRDTRNPGSGRVSDPALALLVHELAEENPGLCVLTSRLASAGLGAVGAPRAIAIELGGNEKGRR